MNCLKRASAVGVAAFLLALMMAPLPETARADMADAVTTLLQPGYNMAGWIEPEADVEELFEALPQLEAVYAWDAENQRFLTARAGLRQRSDADLTTLAPGMGLWLEIGGNEQVSWTRRVTPQPLAGLATLREGWNLVAWVGADGLPYGEAFGSLDGTLKAVLTWDTEIEWFLQYVPDAPSAAALARQVDQGGAVWLEVSEERYWLQPGSVDPTVEFYGPFTEERQAEIRAENLSVVTYFAERYGLLEPDYALYVGTDSNSLEQAQREVIGFQDPQWVLCAIAIDNAVFIADWCATATHDVTSALAHEYFHVLQTHLVSRIPVRNTIYVADWLLEGTAEYAAIEYHVSRGHTSQEVVESVLVNTMTYSRRDVGEIESNISDIDTGGYHAAAFAVRRLVSQFGEAAITDFFLTLPTSAGWEDAFEKVFGSPPIVFYRELSDYVTSIVPDLRSISVTIFVPDGSVIWEWNEYPLIVVVSSHNPLTGTKGDYPSAYLSENGGTLEIPDGSYTLGVQAACHVFGGDFYSSVYYEGIGWYTSDGTPRVYGGQEELVVAGEDLEIVINLAGYPGELNVNCYDGPTYRLAGRIVDEKGDGREGFEVLLYPEKGSQSQEPISLNYTDSSGAFDIAVPDGYAYTLMILDGSRAAFGLYHEDEGLVVGCQGDSWDRATLVLVDGADVTGIDIVIPASLDTAEGC